ncbi:MAG: polysaccharide lyase [Ferruginibacter sp.]
MVKFNFLINSLGAKIVRNGNLNQTSWFVFLAFFICVITLGPGCFSKEHYEPKKQEKPLTHESKNWQKKHPEWIFSDDFESVAPVVNQARYFEYNDNSGDFVPTNSVGVNSSRGMRVKWEKGEVEAGNLKLGFGRVPDAYMDKGIRNTENFREVYYRMYMKMGEGWEGNPYKHSRATVFSGSDWSQAMIAHIWQNATDGLAMDPASGTDAAGNVVTQGYNDFANLTWLGAKSGTTPIFSSENAGKWFCIEVHVKLNDPGQSNGIQEFWINGVLQAKSNNLNFTKTYTEYGINAIFFENYWNSGSLKNQERYIDNIVVSTKRIGF